MSDVYQRLVPTFAPVWMRRKYGNILLEAFGAEMDARAEQVLTARLQSNPWAGGEGPNREGAAKLADGRLIECEPRILNVHALERGIQLYRTEPTLSRRIRLAKWRQLHAQRGTHRGELEHVRPYFATAAAYPVLRIVHRSGSGIVVWHTMSAAGLYSVTRPATPNFTFDGLGGRSRWWAFLELRGTGYSLPGAYNDGSTWDDGAIYDVGSTTPVTSTIAADFIAMFRDWKGAHSKCAGIALVWKAGGLDISAAPSQDVAGWWTLPGAGEWADPIGRPPYVSFIYLDP